MKGLAALPLYARWQARDALLRAFLPVALCVGVAGIPLWSLVEQHGLETVRAAGQIREGAHQIYGSVMELAMTLGAFVLMSGLISADRTKQHHRFLFSRPVVPWQFYLQQFVISALLFVAAFSLIPIGFGLLVSPVPVVGAVQSAAVYAVLYGSLALLCGTLVNKEGALLIVVAMLSIVLQQLERTDVLPRWAEILAGVLPPLVTADLLRSHWLVERAADSGDLVLVLTYAAGMLVVALFVLRRTPLAR